MKRTLPVALVAAVLLPSSASADDFEAGSLIIPMDTEYQDMGMFEAYGLVYELLRNGVPVRWVIKKGKAHDGVDFTVSGTDFATMAAVTDHDYRGGPWVVDSADAMEAESIVEAWQMDHPDVAVHVADAAFTADVSRYLVVAPTLAMVADGNEDIARGYMQAADIPDSILDPAWPNNSPDMLDTAELMGPTDVDHADGSLFDEDGDPVYCQLMSMHWGVKNAETEPEVVAEVRQFLNNPTHFFAECQAVNAFENLDPHGFFLTPNGFEIGDQPSDLDFHQQDSPYAQLHGGYQTVGGSESAYSLPAGDMYKAGGITMLTEAGTPEGVNDVWMTGYLDGACPPDAPECGSYGKVSYLGGHQYNTDLPISGNLDSQGVRMFLNSMFEAPCATLDGLPSINVAIASQACVEEPEIDVLATYVNTSNATALAGSLRMTVPAGATFVSATDGGTFAAGEVTWDLGNLGPDESGDRTATFTLGATGSYDFVSALDYKVGQNLFTLDSNLVSVVYQEDPCPEDPTTTSGSASGTTGGSAGTTTSGSASDSASGTTGASASDSATAGNTDTAGSDTDTDSGTDSGGATGGDSDGSGCSCTTSGGSGGSLGLMALLGLLGLRRRRAALVVTAALTGCSGSGDGKEDTDGITGTDSATDSDSGPTTSTEPKFDVVEEQDVFGGGGVGCNKIDFLFVIDSSGSMADNQANLINSFPGLVNAMEEQVKANDWHIMVVDTDGQWSGTDCANACATLGSCPDAPEFSCNTDPPVLCEITTGSGTTAPWGEAASNMDCGLGSDRYITSSIADLETTFSCIAKVGVDGADTERPMDAMVRATSAELNEAGGCNEGFLRKDAILVVTIITDEPDEGSADDAMTWAQALIDAKAGEPAAVVVLGLLPDGDLANPLCGVEAVPAPRLTAFLDQFDQSSRASVCEDDYAPFFVDAVSIVPQACDDFMPPG